MLQHFVCVKLEYALSHRPFGVINMGLQKQHKRDMVKALHINKWLAILRLLLSPYNQLRH